MKRAQGFIAGVVVGAGLMYLLDPASGRRRRHRIRDQVVRGTHELERTAGTTSARIRNKARGLVAETRNRFSSQDVDDSVLEERVRSHLGRVVSNSGAIAVLATSGMVTLSGPVLAEEVEDLIACVRRVAGVHEVQNQLTVRETPGNISGLQGGRQD